MITYVYECEKCGCFEKRQSYHEEPLSVCPICEEPVKRIIQPIGVQFKGSGFYSTDNRSD